MKIIVRSTDSYVQQIFLKVYVHIGIDICLRKLNILNNGQFRNELTIISLVRQIITLKVSFVTIKLTLRSTDSSLGHLECFCSGTNDYGYTFTISNVRLV